MLDFNVELDAVTAKHSGDAPLEEVGEAIYKEWLPRWERIRKLEAKELVGFLGAEVHHTAGEERQAERREGLGHIKAYNHIVFAEALQDSSAHVDCRGLSAIKSITPGGTTASWG